MKNNIKTYNLKEKFSNIIKSESFVSLISSLISIIMGLLIGFIILLISNPTFAVQGFFSILSGGFSGGLKGIGDVLYFATPIILTGLSVGFAFKTGLFNIGASGQFLVGAFFAIYVGIVWTWLPSGLHWLVALLAAILGGAIWGMIPGLLKAYFNVNEVITSIMLNYIGLYLVNMIIERSDKIFDVTKNQTKLPSSEAILPKLGLNKIFNNSPVNAGIIIAIIFAIIMYIILSKTTFGYELKACGFNRFASKFAGINEKRNIILSMVIAGALAGIGGGLLYLAGSPLIAGLEERSG
jgi:simple sugar transport system permease protein